MRVIIIDDNAGVRSALSMILQEWNFEVASTDTLIEAVSYASISDFSPDAIVLNIPFSFHLNDKDSVNAVFDILNRFFKNSYVIAMTGNSGSQIRMAVDKHGWPLLLKPFSAETLHIALARATYNTKAQFKSINYLWEPLRNGVSTMI